MHNDIRTRFANAIFVSKYLELHLKLRRGQDHQSRPHLQFSIVVLRYKRSDEQKAYCRARHNTTFVEEIDMFD